jgi:hypothetical protein
MNNNSIEEQNKGKQISWSKWKNSGYIERRNEIIDRINNNNL